MGSDPRQHLGRRGEDAAVQHLIRSGFAIVERNYRTRWGELDIIAFDGTTLAFCEVKTRRVGEARSAQLHAVPPLHAIGPRKQLRVRNMARSWLSERTARPRAEALRFDAIGVSFDRQGQLVALEHLEGAF